jgi:uncharacterized protein (TIGR02300 family)
MRNRLIAGHADAAGKRAGAAGGQRASFVHCEKVLKTAAVLPRTCARRHPATVESLSFSLLTGGLQLAKSSTDFPTRLKEPPDVAKPDLGTKRVCSGCGAKFYDLNRTPIVCPKCETVFVPVVAAPRTRPDAAKAPAPAPVAEAVVPETTDAELVSLEDADAEQQGKKPSGKGDDGDDTIEDAAFIEEQEESGDVTDIIGDTPIEKEEES